MIKLFIVFTLFFSQQIANLFPIDNFAKSDLLDIRTLRNDDYKYIFEGDRGELYITTNEVDQKLFFAGHPVRSIAVSPSREYVAISHWSNDQVDENLSLVLFDVTNRTSKEIFNTNFSSWDMTNDPQWLGNQHLFFLRHCGSSCQGLSLLNVHTGEIDNASLSYQSFPDESPFTNFNDWFGNYYHWKGFVKEIGSTDINDKYSLVFVLEDGLGNLISKESVEFVKTDLYQNKSLLI